MIERDEVNAEAKARRELIQALRDMAKEAGVKITKIDLGEESYLPGKESGEPDE
jgi:hypothetical protein